MKKRLESGLKCDVLVCSEIGRTSRQSQRRDRSRLVLPCPSRNEGVEVNSKAARVAPAPGVAHLKRSAIMPRHACAAVPVVAFGGRDGRIWLRRPSAASLVGAETFRVPRSESGLEVVPPWCRIRFPRRPLPLWSYERLLLGMGCSIGQSPNQSPEPTPGSVTPRATLPKSE